MSNSKFPRIGSVVRATKLVFIKDHAYYVLDGIAHECRLHRHRYYITGSYLYV